MTRRPLSTRERLRLFTLHNGRCHICKQKIDGVREKWEISHELPLELGGTDDDQNRKPAHFKCHKRVTAEEDIPRIAKARRQHAAHIGAKASSRPVPGSRNTPWRKRMDGRVERRE